MSLRVSAACRSISTDNSTLTAIADSFDINSEHLTGGIDQFTLTVSATDALNSLDKDVSAQLVNSIHVTSGGTVTIEAVDNETIVATADTETVTITTTPLDKGYFEFGGTFAANAILGQVIASIQSVTLTTTTADTVGAPTAGDVNVDAGNTSLIVANAQAGSTATGGSLAAGLSGAVAINTIGWAGTALPADGAALSTLAAIFNGLLGTTVGETETPSNVTASVVGSTLEVAGALALMAAAQATINATNSNVSNITGSAIGGTKTAAAGGLIASNQVSSTAQAFIQNTTTQTAIGGAATVQATNFDTINANATLINNADASTSGATQLAAEALAKILKLANATPYTSGSGTTNQVLQFGDLVQYTPTYDTSRSLFAPLTTTQMVAIQDGQTVHVSKGYNPELGVFDQTYTYIGPALAPGAKIDLESTNYLDTANWAVTTGSNGGVYKFMGASGSVVNLATGVVVGENASEQPLGYGNLDYWYLEPYSQLLPQGVNIKSATGVGAGGVAVTNTVDGGATAFVTTSTLAAGGAFTVAASDTAQITANINATATASGGSVFGGANSGTVLAVNATIATNQVIGSATADITNSSVTTTGTSSDISVTATNQSTIDATTQSSITAGGSGTGTAIGAAVAFNAIGVELGDIFLDTIDTILSGSFGLGTNPAPTTAFIQDSTISSGGALTVTATSTEQITSTIGNDTTSDAQAFANASGTTADGMAAANFIQADVTAYVNNDNDGKHISSVGAMSVTATDNASDTASSEETSTNAPSNDGGAGLINGYANLALDSYEYTDQSGTQNLVFGDEVWVDDGTGHGTGSVYQYMGPGVLGTPDSVNLSTGNGPGNTGGYANLQYWKQLSQNNIIQGQETDIELGVIGQATDNDKITGNANSYFVLFDFNEVNSSTKAYVENVDFTISAASLTVSATDAASITATDSSVVSASTTGGNNGNGEGYGGLIATNQVNGDAIADIYDASVKTTSGDVSVTADNTSSITATETSSLTAAGNTISLMAAFNVIGWSNDNFAFMTVDSLLGDSSLLGTQTPDLTQAFIDGNSHITGGG